MQIGNLPKEAPVRILGHKIHGVVVGDRISVCASDIPRANMMALPPVFICLPGFVLFLQTSQGENSNRILMLPNDTEVTYDLGGKD